MVDHMQSADSNNDEWDARLTKSETALFIMEKINGSIRQTKAKEQEWF